MDPDKQATSATQQYKRGAKSHTLAQKQIGKQQRPTKRLEISGPRPLKPSEIKRPLLEAERLRLRTAINNSCTPFVYELNSATPKLTRTFVYICTKLDLHDTFFAIIPSRIGTDKAIDSAANALIHLFADCRGDQTSEVLCTQKYAHAITLARESMCEESWRQSDAALLATFLLAFYEHKLRHEKRTFSDVHRNGMCALLVAHASSRRGQEAEVLRSLLYQAWNSSFRTPCIEGSASPFDVQEILDLDPPLQLKLPPELARLRKIANQLVIRLPALIASVRRLRQSDATNTLHNDVAKSAISLLALRDEDGESALLHRVKIVQTASESPLSKSSFHFQQASEFKTAVFYWGARILICRISIALIRMGILVEDGNCSEAILRAENEQGATNMTMTWDFGQAHGAILGRTILVPGYTFVWGVLLDHDIFRGLPSAHIKAWLLTKIHSFEGGMSLHVTEKELDNAAGALVGGPISGLQNPAFESFFGI